MYNLQSIGVGSDGPIRYFWIPGFGSAYAIGDDGSLWSRYKRRGFSDCYISDDWTRLKASVGGDGYRMAFLCFNGNKCPRKVHQLVCEAVYGSCPKGMEVCHNDGDTLNNDYRNLRYDTRVNNHYDKLIHGTDQNGERNHQAVLGWIQVREIRRRYANGVSQKALALEFNVRVSCISRIVNNLRWVEEQVL
jgi:hypothetical protein